MQKYRTRTGSESLLHTVDSEILRKISLLVHTLHNTTDRDEGGSPGQTRLCRFLKAASRTVRDALPVNAKVPYVRYYTVDHNDDSPDSDTVM
jgi:hypothetical protein